MHHKDRKDISSILDTTVVNDMEGFFRSRILSCYRLKKPVETGEEDRRKETWRELLKSLWKARGRKTAALPVQIRQQQEDQLLFLGIPEEWIERKQGLFQILRAAVEETGCDWFYLEPALQKKLCMEQEGQWFFEDYGVLGGLKDLTEYRTDFFLTKCRKGRQRIVVYLKPEKLKDCRTLFLQLAEQRNEMTVLFTGEKNREIFTEQLEEFEEDLEYEYGLIPRTDLSMQRFLELERQRQEDLWGCDFTEESKLLVGLLDGRIRSRVCYLDGMPTPEKEKYGAKRAKAPFVYQSMAEIWRFRPLDGAQVIDTLNKNSYNTIVKWEKYRRILDRKGMRHGRKEKHIDL